MFAFGFGSGISLSTAAAEQRVDKEEPQEVVASLANRVTMSAEVVLVSFQLGDFFPSFFSK